MNTNSSVVAPPERRRAAWTPARWIAVTFLGWTAGFLLAILFLVGVESVGIRQTQSPLALGMGAGVGFVQARMLSQYLGARAPWLAATALGLAAPFIITDILRVVGVPLPYSLPAFVAIGGIFASVLQWRLLRKITRRASLWLFASPVGWMLGGSTVWINDRWLPRIPGLVGALLFVLIILMGGVILGACTAPVLAELREPRND
jgi:hypothetical protein